MKTALEIANKLLKGEPVSGDEQRFLAKAVIDLTKEIEDSHKPLPYSRLGDWEKEQKKSKR